MLILSEIEKKLHFLTGFFRSEVWVFTSICLLVSQLVSDLGRGERGFFWAGGRDPERQYICWAEEQLCSGSILLLNETLFPDQENYLH